MFQKKRGSEPQKKKPHTHLIYFYVANVSCGTVRRSTRRCSRGQRYSTAVCL